MLSISIFAMLSCDPPAFKVLVAFISGKILLLLMLVTCITTPIEAVTQLSDFGKDEEIWPHLDCWFITNN